MDWPLGPSGAAQMPRSRRVKAIPDLRGATTRFASGIMPDSIVALDIYPRGHAKLASLRRLISEWLGSMTGQRRISTSSRLTGSGTVKTSSLDHRLGSRLGAKSTRRPSTNQHAATTATPAGVSSLAAWRIPSQSPCPIRDERKSHSWPYSGIYDKAFSSRILSTARSFARPFFRPSTWLREIIRACLSCRL